MPPSGIPVPVQPADIGWPTGNGKKLRNYQACCLAGPAVPGSCLVSFHFLLAILCPQAVLRAAQRPGVHVLLVHIPRAWGVISPCSHPIQISQFNSVVKLPHFSDKVRCPFRRDSENVTHSETTHADIYLNGMNKAKSDLMKVDNEFWQKKFFQQG